MSQVQVSVVIPAYNEAKCIKDTLHSLVNQNTGFEYEVILVNNNSTDETYGIAKTFQDQMNLRIINEKRQGRGAARARGFNEAKGKIILSADADTIFYKDWVETLALEIKADVVGVTTSCQVVDLSGVSNWLFNLIQPASMVLYRIFLGHYWLSGFSCGILKSVYIKSGGFDESLQSQEDIALSFQVAKLGKIKYLNKPVIFSGRRFKKGIVIGFYDYIRSFTEAFVLKRKSVYLDNPR